MIEPQVGKVKNDHTTSGFTVIIQKKKIKNSIVLVSRWQHLIEE